MITYTCTLVSLFMPRCVLHGTRSTLANGRENEILGSSERKPSPEERSHHDHRLYVCTTCYMCTCHRMRMSASG